MSRSAIAGALVIILPSILLSSLRAQDRIKLEPLPEMIAAEGFENIGRDRRITYVESTTEKNPKTGRPKQTSICYGEHKFLKTTLEGKTVYLHRFWEEVPRFDLGQYELRTSFTLYNDKLQFIVQRKMWQRGDETETQELRWRDGKLYQKIGKKKKETALPISIRPESLLGVMILEGRKNKSKRTVQVLIDGKVEPIEMLMVGITQGEKGAMINYSTKGPLEGQWWISTKGEGLCRARLSKPRVVIDAPPWSRARCGLSLDPKLACSHVFLAKAHKTSSGRKSKWKNKLVGMSLRLPKKAWKQDGKAEKERIFSAETKNHEAALRVCAWFVPWSVNFEGLVDARISTERSKAIDHKIDRQDVEVAGRDSVRMDYKWVSNGHDRREISYFFEGKGCILEVQFSYWLDLQYEADKDLEYILEHLKFDK